MCLADLVQGTHMVSNEFSFLMTPGAGFELLLTANPYRVGIVFSIAGVSQAQLRSVGSPTLLAGILVDNINSPMTFLSKWHGDFVTKAIEVDGTSTNTIYVMEIIIPPEVFARFDPMKSLNG